MVQDVIDRLVAGTHADPDGGPHCGSRHAPW